MFVCVACNRQMRPKKNGFEFIEMAKMSGRGDEQVPYLVWNGDLWECQDCGNEIIYTDPRQLPVAQHYQENFDKACRLLTVHAKEWSR